MLKNSTLKQRFTIRSQNTSKNVILSGLSKIIGIVSQYSMIAILSRRLSNEEFGVWSVFSHFVFIISIFDFGLGGGGLRNELARLNAQQESELFQKKLFLSSFFLIFFTCCVMAILSNVFLTTPLKKIFLLPPSVSLRQIDSIFLIFLYTVFIKMPFSIYGSGFCAYQEIHLKSLLDIIECLLLTSTIACIALLSGAFFNFFLWYHLLSLSIGVFGFVFFLHRRRWKWMKISLLQIKKTIQPLLKIHILFWIQNVVSLLLFSFSPFLINFLGNLKLTGEYYLIYRLHCLFLGIHFSLLNPLWDYYTNALYKQTFYLIEKRFIQSLQATIALFGLAGGFIAIFYKPLIYIWTNKSLDCFILVLFSCIWMILYGMINCLSILLNALNRIKKQVVFLSLGALLNIILGIYFGKLFGEVGVVLASIIALIPLLCSNFLEIASLRRKEKWSKAPLSY